VPRKPKPTAENKEASPPASDSANGSADAPKPKKKSSPAAAAPKKKKPASAKKPATKPPEEAAKKSSTAGPIEPTDEEIRIRAYFLAERRQRLSLPGDSAHDWIEARRQLIEEAGR
jgi:hypothetical protein